MDASKNHYWNYHSLENLLSCKKPLTASADEDLFIAVHQICELAFHQMILDLDRTLAAMALAIEDPAASPGSLVEATYFLNRVNALWQTVNTTMPTLKSMRGFAEFRTSIGPTSGFQSFQFRHIEIMSGVTTAYWMGGTADANGVKHVAETQFEAVYGGQVSAWFEAYRDHNLAAYCDRLLAKASLGALNADPAASPLLEALSAYDHNQFVFHQLHLGLAAIQLRKVGVEVGTGGTTFKDYLMTYERRHTPLFPGLAVSEDSAGGNA